VVGASDFVYFHLLFQSRRKFCASTKVGLAVDRYPMARKRVFNSSPSASSVGIGLKEYGNLGSSHPNKVVDQSLRFVLIRGTQVKDKIGVGRLPLRLGSGK